MNKFAPYLLLLQAGCSTAPEPGKRAVLTERWDTLAIIGGSSVEDTTFADPFVLRFWGDRIAVADWIGNHVRVFDAEGGLKWTAGSTGAGPGEFRQIADIAVAPNGNLWIVGHRNVRISEVDTLGQFVRHVPLQHLPRAPSHVVVLPDRVVFTLNSDIHSIVEVDTGSFAIRRAYGFPWPDSLSFDYNLRVHPASTPRNPTWVAAFQHGPGFMIFRDGESSHHRYVDDIPFQYKINERLKASGADSLRYGALSADIVDGEIYMLFGGRPNRAIHPEEPTRLLDVYDLEGTYLRSYRTPFHSRVMTTDGERFLFYQEDPYPQVVIARPREP